MINSIVKEKNKLYCVSSQIDDNKINVVNIHGKNVILFLKNVEFVKFDTVVKKVVSKKMVNNKNKIIQIQKTLMM